VRYNRSQRRRKSCKKKEGALKRIVLLCFAHNSSFCLGCQFIEHYRHVCVHNSDTTNKEKKERHKGIGVGQKEREDDGKGIKTKKNRKKSKHL
jgi:hypothetical protein